MKKRHFVFAMLASVALSAGQGVAQVQSIPTTSDFVQPLLHQHELRVDSLLKAGALEPARKYINQLKAQFPAYASPYYSLAKLNVREGRVAEAFENLDKAIERGDYRAEQFTLDPAFQSLRSDERFQRFLSKAKQVESERASKGQVQGLVVRDQRALLSEVNTHWDTGRSILQSYHAFPKDAASQQVVASVKPEIDKLVNEWFQHGRAAGNWGDLYDNRDRAHSKIHLNHFKQVSQLVYSSGAKKFQLDYGLNTTFLHNAITVGNSSMALTQGLGRRSLVKQAQVNAYFMRKQALQYGSNQMYVYPAVSDFTPAAGDNFAANSPYYYTTIGRSGSDKPVMQALFYALAALKPDVKTKLRQTGLTAPTLQYLMRQSLKGVDNPEDYLSAKAHPIAFDGANIDVLKLVNAAQALTWEDIPPLATVKVLDETRFTPGIDDFALGQGNRLFDLPNSVARVVRGTTYEQRMIVELSHQKIIDSELPVTHHWRVLNGDKDRIKIKPLNDEGSRVEISVPWHDPRPSPGHPDIMTNRVEVAGFVQVGEKISVPAFINFLYPPRQKRTYDADGKLLRLEHDPHERATAYMDPYLFVERHWTDLYEYDDNGKLIGWERLRKHNDLVTERFFNAKGEAILSFDDNKKPTRTSKIKYSVRQKKGVLPQAIEDYQRQ